MNKIRDLVGERFGRLTVVEMVGKNKHGHYLWKCNCDCGNACISAGEQIKSGNKKSCGCLKYTQEGKSRNGTSLYKTWRGMMRRCYEETHQAYQSYGGRGIRVCEQWHDFLAFERDVGCKPRNSCLDRIDNDRDYEPSNVRWASMREQSNNRRSNVFVEIDGHSNTIAEWARHFGLKVDTVNARIYTYGWDVVKALTTPVQSRSYT